MKNDRFHLIMVSKVQRVWLRRLLIVLCTPFIAIGNIGLAVFSLLEFLVLRSNIALLKSAIEHWKRK